jgi:hypothetical protein
MQHDLSRSTLMIPADYWWLRTKEFFESTTEAPG